MVKRKLLCELYAYGIYHSFTAPAFIYAWICYILGIMKDVANFLNEMLADGIVSNYAILGAVAQMRYTEAVVTMDLDVLVAL